MIMKFLSKISIFLLSAAIFMSALVVFAGSSEEMTPEWPYLKLTISISEKNRIEETDKNALNAKISDAVSAPFFALTRDYPDLTMWIKGFNLKSTYSHNELPTKEVFTLMSVEYTLNGNPKYGDPSGMLKQLQDVVDGFTPSGDTMYDKLASIHDYICKRNTYIRENEGAPYCYSAYGSLVDRKSVCEGYAEAFKLLCDKVGIDCVLVTGMSLPNTDNDNTEAHMWNLVRMDDDAWYAVDVTWDDAGDVEGNYNYFLVGTDTVVRGRKFNESHLASYDFITIGGDTKTIPSLEYPMLSSSSYDKDNGKTEYVYSTKRYHYDFLDDIQKEIYDKMLAALLDNIPSDPSKTPGIETTDSVTTTPENTTESPQTTPTETTTKEETTKADTTTPEETTTKKVTTEPPEDTTTDIVTVPVDTTPTSTTKPPVTSTQKETDPPVSSTTVKPDTTVTDTVHDTTEKPDDTGRVSTSDKNNDPHEREMQKLYETVTTVVIVSAITCLSIILGYCIIRYAKKNK